MTPAAPERISRGDGTGLAAVTAREHDRAGGPAGHRSSLILNHFDPVSARDYFLAELPGGVSVAEVRD
jgi:hypothetical protein